MSAIIITVYSQFDTVMIGFIKGDSAVGIYNAALKIRTIVISISTGITSVLVPRMSVYYSENQEKFKQLLIKSFKISIVVLMPLAVFIFLNGEDVLLFLCGAEYLSANTTLRILMICVCALMLTNYLVIRFLFLKEKKKDILKVYLLECG